MPVRRPLLVSILACLVWSVALADLRLLNRSSRRRLSAAEYVERLKRKKQIRTRTRQLLMGLSVLLIVGSVGVFVVYWQTGKYLADSAGEADELLNRSGAVR